MSSVNELRSKHANLVKIIAEAKTERKAAEAILADLETRNDRKAAREKQALSEVAQRFPSLGGR